MSVERTNVNLYSNEFLNQIQVLKISAMNDGQKSAITSEFFVYHDSVRVWNFI